MSSDAGDESAKDERSDDDLDEAEENIAENAELSCKGGRVEAEFETGEHGEKNPEGEGAFAQASGGEGKKSEATENNEGLVSRNRNEKQTACEEEDESCEQQEFELRGAVLWQAVASRRAD